MTNFLGALVCTAYVATGHPCADGRMPRAGITVAAPRSVPLHSKVIVEGVGVFEAEDRTARRFDGRVDIFMRSRREAINFGKQTHRVWVVKP